jgi:hypothetical protein
LVVLLKGKNYTTTFFFSWQIGAKFLPPLGRHNHHNKRFYFEFTTCHSWMKFKVLVCI